MYILEVRIPEANKKSKYDHKAEKFQNPWPRDNSRFPWSCISVITPVWIVYHMQANVIHYLSVRFSLNDADDYLPRRLCTCIRVDVNIA
jgi:hypothetical protein